MFPPLCHQETWETTLLLEKGTKSISSSKWLHLAKLLLCLLASGADGGWIWSVRSPDTVAWSRAQVHTPVYRSAPNAHNEHCQSLFCSEMHQSLPRKITQSLFFSRSVALGLSSTGVTNAVSIKTHQKQLLLCYKFYIYPATLAPSWVFLLLL